MRGYPAQNEESGIVGTLAALAAQVDRHGRPLDFARYEIIVLANNCRDRTAALTRQFAQGHPELRLHLIDAVLPPPHAHIGAARRLVMDEAYRRLTRLGRPRGVIASTDGDTQVRPGWVTGILREMARGADVVGGRIQSSREEIAGLDPGARLYYHRDLAYRTLRAAYESILLPDPHNAWPRHHHCFGASLAVTAETYLPPEGSRRCLAWRTWRLAGRWSASAHGYATARKWRCGLPCVVLAGWGWGSPAR